MLPEAEQQHATLISLTCADTFSAKVFDEARELVTSEEIPAFLEIPGKIKAIIKPAWIWITGGKFGTICFPIHAGTA